MVLLQDVLSQEQYDELGLFDMDDTEIIPFALHKLTSPVSIRNYYSSSMG
eukprot:CAMPEP_0197825918 /NCGR_PEP_ID=MMETSP1437-20131217/2947_1 /TAXON_ID=49252 ORGANISM="Eucampia antarctica, Strain CCMP1452" /NCGR_SAMPLE_ID=MMETSP1437 /ASSEMBLY_ACC=CAM_ASM_001096 /LENGTH=49 /DNA_ID=CAMNT_0043426135 /DNA_START=144 /DNA_END=293 /DNA_ORIENTATION=+